ncbi:hypothetical protein CAPTEDRAFT_227521 [Capitella teleta]|uniref:DUF4806 domain-containing protein n=1 Tax=Capitella teleta TaxID=283909 RepID=R7UQE3_CAPTE|nr:hypothetical protein CAPTEDRAFT_227521 [Capitella teleta]|eukprot:ELU06147.1 hypothetical protein CAPTEDRAFT_227521 [Capitella teleta]
MAGSQKRNHSIEDEEPSPSRKRQALFTGFHGSNYTSNSSGTIVIHPEMGMHPQMPSLIHPNVHNLAHSSAVNDDISASLSSLYMLSQQMIAAQSDTNVKIDSVLSSIQEKEILVIPQTDDPHNISPLHLNLPVHSIEELEVLERRILQKEFKSKLSLHISMIGGGTTKDVINRAMSFVLSHEVAVLFNWKGRSSWKTARSDSSSENKRAFSDLKLCQVIIKAVMTSALRSATAADIEVAMKMWLRNAPDRCGGRQRRALAKKLKETD